MLALASWGCGTRPSSERTGAAGDTVAGTAGTSADGPGDVASAGGAGHHGQRAGPADGGAGGDCAMPGTGETTPFASGYPAHDDAVIDAYLDGLCFGLTDPEQNDRTFPVDNGSGSGSVKKGDSLWLQTELRMLATDPNRLARGQGLVVAKVRNPNGKAVRLDRWERPLPGGRDAYLWMGRDSANKLYSVLFSRREQNGNRKLTLISTGTWQPESLPPHSKAMAYWDPHAVHPTAQQVRQKPGSGWVACSPGCCTAVDLNADAK